MINGLRNYFRTSLILLNEFQFFGQLKKVFGVLRNDGGCLKGLLSCELKCDSSWSGGDAPVSKKPS